MLNPDKVLRDIYISDVILMEEEMAMMESVDESYFDKLESLYQKLEHGSQFSKEDIKDLEKSFEDFYFEYAFVQFKRGLELGLCMKNIC